MQMFFQIISDYNSLIILIFTFLFLFLIIYSFTLRNGLKKLNERLYNFTKGAKINDLEQVIEEYSDEINSIKKNIKNSKEQIDTILRKLETFKGKTSVVRYNAFGEEGNDLSYSIAILDENKNGLVISSIYNRGESNTYAKPILIGESNYKLSTEELLAIENAMKE